MVQFRKTMKILPGARLNFSKGGISTSVGVNGANLTLGKNGVHSNVGLPGTGLYSRQKISGRGGKSKLTDNNIDLNYSFKKVYYFHLGLFIGYGILWGVLLIFLVPILNDENNMSNTSVLAFGTIALSFICLYISFISRKKKRDNSNIQKLSYIITSIADLMSKYTNSKEFEDVEKNNDEINYLCQYIDQYKADVNVYKNCISDVINELFTNLSPGYNLGIISVIIFKHSKVKEKVSGLVMQSAINRHMDGFIADAKTGISLLKNEDGNYNDYLADINKIINSPLDT